MNSICLDKLARPRDLWTSWVIPADTWLPRPVKTVVTAQDAPHTTERNRNSQDGYEVVLYHLSTALKLGSYSQNQPSKVFAHGSRTRAWPGAVRGDTPGTPAKVILSTVYPAWTVRIIHLDVLVQYVPFPLPAPHRTAVYAASIRDRLHWKLLTDEQLHRESSRFREVRVGRIGHGRLLSVMFALYSVGRLPFWLQWMLQRW